MLIPNLHKCRVFHVQYIHIVYYIVIYYIVMRPVKVAASKEATGERRPGIAQCDTQRVEVPRPNTKIACSPAL